MTAADVLIDTLLDWDVEVIFGLPGDGINGIFESLRQRQDKLKFVQVRHEEAAAFMATGYAKVTGKLGVCLATSGPGGIHLLNGLYDAKMDGVPVLAITGMTFHDLLNTHAQQDVELDKLFMDVCIYNTRVMGPAHVENVTQLACRTALSYRGVAHITIPKDIQEQKLDNAHRSRRNKPGHTSNVYAEGSKVPTDASLRQAAQLINEEGNDIVILAGQGALDATDELEQLAETLGAPIIKALLGKACVPDDSPYTTGGIGLLGTAPSQNAMNNCKTLITVGSSFPYISFYPKPGQAKCVQIDRNPGRIGLRYPVDVGLVGDSKKTLQLLLPMLERKENRKFLQTAQKEMKSWWEYMDDLSHSIKKPMKPQVVAAELNKHLREDAITTCDSGTIATWWARHIIAKRGQFHTLSGNLATMAPGLPYAIAAQVAYPNRQVVAFVGDGGFSMLMAEMATAVKYDLPIKVVLIKNNYLGQIKWEQMVMEGNPEFGVQLQPIDFAQIAHACGAVGYTVEDPKDCGDVMQKFLNAPGPAVLQAVVDPFTAPLPGNIRANQALKFAESIARGEEDPVEIMKEAFRDKARQII